MKNKFKIPKKKLILKLLLAFIVIAVGLGLLTQFKKTSNHDRNPTTLPSEAEPDDSLSTEKETSLGSTDSHTCYGMIQNIFSPDDPNLVYLGKAIVKVNTQTNTLEYWIAAGGSPEDTAVTLKLLSETRSIPLSSKQDDTLIYEGEASYQENQEKTILFGDTTENYFQFPLKEGKQAYAYFGSNFTPTSCDAELTPNTALAESLSPVDVAPPLIWKATHESGNITEWNQNSTTQATQDSNYCTRPLQGVSNEVAHSGTYSLKMTIDTSIEHAGCRTFRYPEMRNGNTYYYSAWFYLPEQYIIYGNDPSGAKVSGWNNLMQIKAKKAGQTGSSTLFWSVGLSNRQDGTMYLFTKWDKNEGIRGPSIAHVLSKSQDLQFHQDKINVYPKKWFHLEMRVKQNTYANYNGRITVWQDGIEIFDMDKVIVRQPYVNPLKPSFASWSVNSYGGVVSKQKATNSKSLYPKELTVFVDDAVISTERVGPNSSL